MGLRLKFEGFEAFLILGSEEHKGITLLRAPEAEGGRGGLAEMFEMFKTEASKTGIKTLITLNPKP